MNVGELINILKSMDKSKMVAAKYPGVVGGETIYFEEPICGVMLQDNMIVLIPEI